MPTYTFLTGGSTASPENLRAKTWCKGKRIDVRWSPFTTGPTATFKLKRSRRTFSLFIDDDTETVFTGTTTFYSDTGLEENTVYYYTLYWSIDLITWYVSDKQRVAGLSIKDYTLYDGEDWLYRRLPQELRRQDALDGTDQYTLKRYCDVLQCGLSLQRGMIEAYAHLANYDKIPAGRVGEPENQYGILEAVNKQLGFDPIRALGVEVMRRVALGINHVRKNKGTCTGLTEYVKMLSGWDGTCTKEDDFCGGSLNLATWDGVSGFITGSGVAAPDFSSATLTFAGDVFADSNAAWTPTLFERGVLYGPFGEYICISSNTETELTFETPGQSLVVELLFASADVTGLGTSVITISQNPGSKPFNTSMFDGYEVLDDDDVTIRTVTASVATSDGLSIQLTLSGILGAAATLVGIAPDYVAAPPSWAGRTINWSYKVSYGSIYRLWDPLMDLRLLGSDEDPFDVLWAGDDIFSEYPLSPTDTVFLVDAGVAVTIGRVTAMTANTLTLDVPLTIDEHLGRFINPNRNQPRLFEILGNDGTTLYFDPAVNLFSFADVGSKYFILKPMDAVRYDALQGTVRRILPDTTKLYIWFQ